MERDHPVGLEEVLCLARQIAAQLDPLLRTFDEARALRIRLAHAYALGLVDQLEEIAFEAGAVSTPTMKGREPDPAQPV